MPDIEIRDLRTPDELRACVDLQRRIWGLPDSDVTSLITLEALTMDEPRLGLVRGAFVDGELCGMSICLAGLEPGTAYGHMYGLLPGARDMGLGARMHEDTISELKRLGARRMVATCEPLESRNAHLYLNRFGGRAVRYKEAAYEVDCDMHRGLPLDRFLVEWNLEGASASARPSLDQALAGCPVATPGNMPDAGRVLVDIPPDLAALKEQRPDKALEARLATRTVFTEYLNRRGYQAVGLVTGETDLGRRSLYLLERPEAAR